MKAELTINVRPVRHVYFIDENDLERFVDVASYCCTQWGGINNLIIPITVVKEAQNISYQVHRYLADMTRRRHPDIFVDAVSDREGNGSIHDEMNAQLASDYPGKLLNKWDSFIESDIALHPLNIISSQGDISKPELAMPSFISGFSQPLSALDDAMTVAAFGRIWPGQQEEYEEIYTFKARNALYPDILLYYQTLIDPHASVINLTLKDLHNLGTEMAFPSLHFDIVIAQKVWDLCWFWNLRAQSFGRNWLDDRRVLLLSKAQLFQEQGAYFEPLIRLLREKRSHSHITSNLDVSFHHYHDEEIHQFLQKCNELQQHEGTLQVSMHSPRKEVQSKDTKSRPIAYKEDSVSDFSIYHEYGGSRPTFSQELVANSETFLTPNVGPRTVGFREAYIGLQSDFWHQFLRDPSVANLIISNSSFDVFLNTVQLSYKHGFPPQGLQRVTFNIPKTWDIYQAYFRSKGYEVSPSDKKFYADGLVGMAGGFEQEKVQVLCSRIAREILDFLTDKATTKLAREIIQRLGLQSDSVEDLQQIIANLDILPQNRRVPKTFKDIYSNIRDRIELTQVEKKASLQILTKLVGIKMVQRGMYIKCSHCGTKMWYGIHILDEQIQCSGCLEMFDLPLTENVNDEVERAFQYSLNPLANQAMDQDVLPVIAALLTLKTSHQVMHHIVMGMNFQQVGRTNREGDFDFVYVYKQELYGGECKTGGNFTDKDINTARLAQSLGFRAFFFASMKAIAENGQRLIAEYQQELANIRDSEHPFDVFVLNEQIIFKEASLPQQIPQ